VEFKGDDDVLEAAQDGVDIGTEWNLK